ncbi:MAG: hypothetical protein II574_08600 [Ruminococcus sp.]|nr:hypothetical protein [Ruminococcus sp.]
MAVLTSLHLGEHGTYMGAGFDYEYTFKDGKHSIKVRVEGVTSDDALVIDVDEKFAQKLIELIDEYSLRKWDGYQKSDNNVLDGSGFGFYATFDDGTRISASGYECYPRGYAEAAGALGGLFLPLYEAIRPNKRKVMTKYFEEVILKDNARLEKKMEVSYPYISKGGNMFSLGKCECTGGAAMYPVYSDENEPPYMLVVYLKDTDDKWVLSCEVYHICDDGKVELWGDAEIDPCFFSSDKIYGHIFTRQHGGLLMLGVFTQRGYSASGRDSKFFIDLYDIDDHLKPLANEMVEGPTRDKAWWTPDKIANFTEVAEKYGFVQSMQHWEEMPNDPVFAGGMKDSANHRFDFSVTNNHNGDFYNTLLGTPEGECVGDYRVKGNLYTHQ